MEIFVDRTKCEDFVTVYNKTISVPTVYQSSLNIQPFPYWIMAHTGQQRKPKHYEMHSDECEAAQTKAGWEQPSHEMSGIEMRQT